MSTRCKFVCTREEKYKGWSGQSASPFLYNYKFSAVTGDSSENKKFFEATPSGELNVSTVRENFFEVGKEYYLDITLVEEVQ